MRRALLADTLAVAVFALVGRRSHSEALSLSGWWHTAWPFLGGLLLGWAAAAALRQRLDRPVVGLLVAAVTVVVGMALRTLAGEGTAAPFVVVASLFLGGCLLGWRVLAGLLRRAGRPAAG